MSKSLLFAICTLVLSTACKEFFVPEIEKDQAPLVVDGLITDAAEPYSIRLSKAASYDNSESYDYRYTAVRGVNITVSDDCGHTYHFAEQDTAGLYTSSPSEFIGVPGRSYTLQIRTADNIEYRSAPQLLLPNNFNVTVESGFGTQDQLIDNGNGAIYKETMRGTNLFYTIENNEDTLIRFRFTQKIIKVITYTPYGGWCWGIAQQNNLINITDDQLSSNKSIEKHIACFVPYIKPVGWVKDGMDHWTIVTLLVPKISQYRLNAETYQYYKNCNKILSASGKIFDPIASQVKGNITCVSDKNKEVLGFFEASSVSVKYYALNNGSKEIKCYPDHFAPSDDGCVGREWPEWWIW